MTGCAAKDRTAGVMRAASICVVKELPFTLEYGADGDRTETRSARWSGLQSDWGAVACVLDTNADPEAAVAPAGSIAGGESRGRI